MDIKYILSHVLGMEPYQRSGNDYRYRCPFCDDEKIKFYIGADRSHFGLWHCFNCDQQGNLTGLVMKVGRVSYAEAQQKLNNYDTVIDDYQPAYEDDTFLSMVIRAGQTPETIKITKHAPRMPTGAKRLLDNMNNREAVPYFKYLHGRGVSLADIQAADIHYVVDGTFFNTEGKEFSLRKSIVFLTHYNGETVYWSSRSIEKDPWIKSLNAPARDDEYARREIVYGLDQANGRSLVLCEGIFNAFTVTNERYLGLATLGKQVTNAQIKLIVANSDKFDKLYLFQDTDANIEEYGLVGRFVDAGLDEIRILVVNNPFKGLDANDLGRVNAIKLVDAAKPVSLAQMLHLLGGN